MASTSAFAFETIGLNDLPKGLTASVYAPPSGIAEKAFITCEGDCRYRYDGDNPDHLHGHLLKFGDSITLHGELQIRNFKAVSSGFATLQVSYERQ